MVAPMKMDVKRVYDPSSPEDGYRVLVDRLWPRGVSEAHGRIDLWLRDIAPTTELRTWYQHDVAKWPEFERRYERELERHGELLDLLLDIGHHRGRVTLLFGARDEQHNEANVLLRVLSERRTHTHA
jgi:uncharacterized protein YeaO (DUF488 family)